MQVSQIINNKKLSNTDNKVLLKYILNCDDVWLISNSNYLLSLEQETLYQQLSDRAVLGEPLAYIVECKEFYSLKFNVNSSVLIPRPDTEIIIEYLINTKRKFNKVLDLGTGSGILAITLKKYCKIEEVIAIDKSIAAIEVAIQNAKLHDVDIKFMESDWFSAINDDKFDLIVSNPPYIESNDPHLINLSFEPISALVSDDNGLNDIKNIVLHAKDYLENNGLLIVEHGYNQSGDVFKLFENAGYENIEHLIDYGNNIRCTLGCI